MAYVKVPAPSVVYHLAKADRLDSILDDGQIRRFEDSECWFCESLPKMKAYMEQTVMCEGKPYYAVGGQLCRYPKFVPEDYVLLKLAPCQPKDNWYRWDQEVPPGSPKELINAAKEFSALKIGYRGDLWFSTAETIDVPAFLHGEIISQKQLTSGEAWSALFNKTENEMAGYAVIGCTVYYERCFQVSPANLYATSHKQPGIDDYADEKGLLTSTS